MAEEATAGKRKADDEGTKGDVVKAPKVSEENGTKTALIEAIRVESVQTYAARRPSAMQLPQRLASFSYDERRALHHDDRSVRYYHAPPPQIDLNRGFAQLVSRDESVNEHLDSLCLALMHLAQEDESKDEERRRTNVITWRGMMTRLCTALYEKRNGFEMNAMVVGDTLYLEEHVGPRQAADKARQQGDDRQKRFAYYGYAFESYTCFEQKSGPTDPRDHWDGDVNTNVQWCSIVRTKLGTSRLILGGEVDAVDRHDPSTMIEVKTSMQIRNQRDEANFESKLLRFYFQSFLLGVQRLVVGFRDGRGIVRQISNYETLKVPRFVRGRPTEWDPVACLNFADEILSKARRRISEDQAELSAEDEPSVYRLCFHMPFDQITLSKLSPEQVSDDVHGGQDDPNRVGFLLKSYYDFARASLPKEH